MGLLIKDILNLGEQRLKDAGIHDAKYDANQLFLYSENIDRNTLFKLWGSELNDISFENYCRLLDRRSAGEPLQYIIGNTEFMGLTFRVTPDVLIPRLDTEVVVDEALKLMKEHKVKKVLDLCTGSGAIAVSVAKLADKVDVSASDISQEALKIAAENASANGVKIDFKCGDMFAPFKRKIGGNAKFDMIISNPPYIPSQDIEGLMTEVKDHEPRLALDGGDDGLDFYRTIIEQAPDYLKKGGILVLEIGSDQAHNIEEIAGNTAKYKGCDIKKDLAGLDRVAVLMIN